MSRPEWVKCLRGEQPSQTACGRPAPLGFVFLDLEHARNTVENGSLLAPCPACWRDAGGGVYPLSEWELEATLPEGVSVRHGVVSADRPLTEKERHAIEQRIRQSMTERGEP